MMEKPRSSSKSSFVLLILLFEVAPSIPTRVPVLCYCSHKQQSQPHHQYQQQYNQPQQEDHHQPQQNHHQPQQKHHQPQQNHYQPQQNHYQPQQNNYQPQQNYHQEQHQPERLQPHNNDNRNNHQKDNTPVRCSYCIRPKCDPAGCTAAHNFDAAKDAKAFKDAVKGLGTKEDTLIEILTHRSDEQIEMIRQEYFKTGSSLQDDIKGDTSFKTKALLLALVTPRPLYYAEQLHRAFDKGDTSTMIEIMTSLSPCGVREVASEYEKGFNKKSLREAIKRETCFDFENFMLELAKGNRAEDQKVDAAAAKKDAKALYNAGVGKWLGTDEKTFIDIFATRSYAQLREIIKEYNSISSSGIKKDIKSETSDKLQKGLLTLVKNIEDQPAYLADELEESLDTVLPVPDDNNKLIRIMRARCGVDLGDIRDAYPKQDKGRSLADRIKGKTYMDYEKALLSMLHK